MKRWKEKTRYQTINFFKELIFFFISSFMSFPLHVKRIILCFVYSYDYKPTNAYSSLSKEYVSSSCTIDLDLISSYDFIGKNEVHILIPPEVDPSCKPVNNKVDLSPPQVITAPFCGQLTYVQSKIREGYKPLKLPFVLHDYPPNFLDYLPRFNGEDHVTVEQHMVSFEWFTDLLQIIHEDVFMRTFFQSLYGDVGFWFRNLKVDSISSWTDLRNVFLRYWGEKKSFEQYLSEFYALRREQDETVIVFNRRFHNFYLNMPMEIQPTEVAAMVQYTIAQHPDLVIFLRERRSSSLHQMFTNAEEIEENI
jgi:hypothetical protein